MDHSTTPSDLARAFHLERFRDYLACPYRYYLRHECELKAVDDAARELDGAAFGMLLHKVLGVFGRDRRGPRHSERERDIFDYLAERLTGISKELYGSEVRRPAVRLQLEQARQPATIRSGISRLTALNRSGFKPPLPKSS